MKKILIIEDTPEIIEALEIILKTAGFEVHAYQNADNILEIVSSILPDAIILDALLAGHDGPSISKFLKSRPETSKIPVLMISAHPALERMATESNADAFLPKPFSIPSLLSKLDEVMGSAKIV